MEITDGECQESVTTDDAGITVTEPTRVSVSVERAIHDDPTDPQADDAPVREVLAARMER